MTGQQLKRLRLYLKLRATFVADLMGTDANWIFKLEQNNGTPDEREEYFKILLWCASDVVMCNVKDIYNIALEDS